jgi:hypothetical protein
LAKIFFQLDSAKFPSLSILSLDDYDLFSGDQIDILVRDLIGFLGENPLFFEPINSMLKIFSKAKSLDKTILFDPFRRG